MCVCVCVCVCERVCVELLHSKTAGGEVEVVRSSSCMICYCVKSSLAVIGNISHDGSLGRHGMLFNVYPGTHRIKQDF